MVDKLDEDQINEYKEAFQIFDKDGSGSIDVYELRRVFRSLGKNLTRQEVQDLFDEVDTDGSGGIEFEEFLQLMAKQTVEGTQKENFATNFKYFDPNNTGKIKSIDLTAVIRELAVEGCEEVIKVIEEETDAQGYLHYKEFVEKAEKLIPA